MCIHFVQHPTATVEQRYLGLKETICQIIFRIFNNINIPVLFCSCVAECFSLLYFAWRSILWLKLGKRIFFFITFEQSEQGNKAMPDAKNYDSRGWWMGLLENASQLSHVLICLSTGDKERGANVKLTEFYTQLTPTVSEHNWILFLISRQRLASISWTILWRTGCSLSSQFSLFNTSHIWKQHAVSMCVLCPRDAPGKNSLIQNWDQTGKMTLLSHIQVTSMKT